MGTASRAIRGWRSALASTGGGGGGGSAPPSSVGGGVGDDGGKQDVTYVPTSMLRSRASTNSLLAGGDQVGTSVKM